MPDLMDRLYCSEQIHIPPTFPFIMKLYCKAAIRTQPYDLLKWSAAYFRALANGEEPPVKERIEYPPYDSPTGLTPGYIKMLIKQLGKDPEVTVSAQTLFLKWNCICLEDELLVKLLALMGAKTSVNWLKFVSISCGFISASLTNTMILLCEVLTDEPEGGMATIPLGIFNELYTYLAGMECGPLTEEEEKQFGDGYSEEDVSVVAEKIRSAVYEGEIEGELFMPEQFFGSEEKEEMGEGSLVLTEKEIEDYGKIGTVTSEAPEEKPAEEIGEASSGEDVASGDKAESKESFGVEEEEPGDPAKKVSDSAPGEEMEEEHVEELQEPSSSEEPVKPQETPTAEIEEEEEKKAKSARKIKLEDIEDSIRLKIQEKLDMDEDSTATEEGFQDLSSYLIAEAEAAKKRTAEQIGFRIFRKYMRQEVPGIGPKIDAADVERVIDFMDYNSHKQEGMVMPRNIRHWMCPPLERVRLMNTEQSLIVHKNTGDTLGSYGRVSDTVTTPFPGISLWGRRAKLTPGKANEAGKAAEAGEGSRMITVQPRRRQSLCCSRAEFSRKKEARKKELRRMKEQQRSKEEHKRVQEKREQRKAGNKKKEEFKMEEEEEEVTEKRRKTKRKFRKENTGDGKTEKGKEDDGETKKKNGKAKKKKGKGKKGCKNKG